MAESNTLPNADHAAPRKSRRISERMLQRLGMLPVLVVLYLIFYALTIYLSGDGTSNFATPENTMNILRQVAINLVLAAGMTFVILTAGIDLSVGSVLAVSAVLGMQVSLTAAPGWSIPMFIVSGLAMGLINGAMVAFLNINAFVVTLGTMTAFRGAAYLLADGTTVINSSISFEWIGNNYLGPVPWLVVIALAVIAVCWFILRRTTLGVHIYAVGGNMQAARLTGIKVWMVLLFVYGMSGLLSGLGGVMSASRLYSANGNLGTGYELDAIAAVILGGTSFVGGIGTITGTLVGALIIATLNNGMTLMGVSYFWQLVIKGAVIIIAVLIDKYRTRHHQSA
jgi:ribose transport system permease protein